MTKDERAKQMNARFKAASGVTLVSASKQTPTGQAMNALLRDLASPTKLEADAAQDLAAALEPDSGG